MRHGVVITVVSVVAISICLLGAAQETTGALQGRVADGAGAPLAEVAVEATGPFGAIAATTDASGRFRLPRLAPGTYVVTANLVGFQPVASEPVRVILGETVTVDFSLQQSFTEEIAVYSDTVSIDFSESQTATSIRQWEIDYLPRGRDFTDVVTYAPGTVLDYQGGGIMVDGASGLENRYIVDGLDTTDPFKGFSLPMRAEFMEEVQVKSAGYMAEFGGATGGVINAVTRSGGNEFHGSLFVDVENNDWNGAARPEVEYNLDFSSASLVTYPKDDNVRFDPGFTLGGPILRDRLWFFASYQPGLRSIERTVAWVYDPPDTYRQDLRVDYAAANLTANLGSRLLLKLALNVSPYTQEGTLPNRDGLAGIPDQEFWAPLGEDGERETYALTGDWIVDDSFVVSARGGLYHTDFRSTGIPLYDLIHGYSVYSLPGFLDRHPEIPSAAQHNPGWYSNRPASNTYRDVWERLAAGLDATWFFRAAGDHVLKAGYQGEEISEDVRRALNADRILYYWDRPYITMEGQSVRGTYGYFYLANPSTLGKVASRNQALFIQDAWSVLPNLTLNLGVRSEREEIPNYGVTGPDPAIAFDWGDKLAPRLGFAWDIRGDARWKLYGSWGRYYDVTKYSLAVSFGARRAVYYYFAFDNPDIYLNEATTCRTGRNTVFERPECPAGTFIEARDFAPNAADPAYWAALGYPLIDPDLEPMETWEAQLGLEHQLTATIQLGARYAHKVVVRTIEDVGLVVPDVGQIYVIGNPGEGITTGIGELAYGGPVREYDALELILDKRFADRWMLRAYYTLSRLWGNYSGLANSDEQNSFGDPLNPQFTAGRLDPNVSRLWDMPGSMYDQDGDLVYGRLPTDRTHQLGAQLLYSFDFGLNLGLTQYVGSGTPVSSIGLIPIGTFFYPFGRGDLGDTPWLTQTDLALNYTVLLGKGLGLSLGLTVLNLFDEDTPTRMSSWRNWQDIQVTDQDFLTGFDFEAELAALGPEGPDPSFGLWDTFQLPRTIRLTLKVEF